MNNAGKIDSQDKLKTDTLAEEAQGERRSPLLLLIFAGVLAVCLLIGLQAFGILYSIVLPPLPPLPEDVSEIRHTSIDHGVDEWLYKTDALACDVVDFYITADGQCAVTANQCGDDPSSNTNFGSVGQHVATCAGEVQFNIFAYRWEANIADGYQDGQTQFSLIREVFWTGAVPPKLDPRTGFEFDG